MGRPFGGYFNTIDNIASAVRPRARKKGKKKRKVKANDDYIGFGW